MISGHERSLLLAETCGVTLPQQDAEQTASRLGVENRVRGLQSSCEIVAFGHCDGPRMPGLERVDIHARYEAAWMRTEGQ
jgi:hypothetical protein